ncbi:hypothetical protein L6R52_19345 [Myxococcota bacterium]|nr:hypothetical protein [Myxococcota bacterium]
MTGASVLGRGRAARKSSAFASRCGAARWLSRAPLSSVMLLALTACLRSSIVEVDVAPEIDRVAVVELDAAGAFVAATELAEWRPGAALPIVAHGASDAIVVGWRSSALEAAGASLDALAGARLERATGCALAVPTPSWAARWTASGALEPVDTTVVPMMTASWMRHACGAFAASTILVDVPCVGRRCPQPEVAPGACTFEADLSSCGVGVVRGSIDHEGALCVELSTTTWRCARADATTSFAAAPARFTCDEPLACALDVHVVPRDDEAPFTIDRLRFVDRPPYLPEGLRVRPEVGPWRLSMGYGLDAAALDELVFVSFIDAEPASCLTRAGHLGTWLHGYRSDTFERVVARALPSCADRLIPDGRGGLLVTFFEDGAWMLGRFDRAGERVASRTISVLGPNVAASSVVDDLVLVEDPPAIAVLFGPAVEGNAPPMITLHDVDTLVERSRTELPIGRAYSMALEGRGRLVLSANDSNELAWFDVAGARLDGRAPTAVGDLLRAAIYRPLVDAARARILVPSQGDATLLSVGEVGDLRARAPFSETFALLVSGLHWPAGTGRVLFAGGTDHGAGDRRVAVTSFDPETERFLPGSHELGFGVPSRLVEDDRGRAWVLLPWAGEIVRLTPRAAP